MLSVKVGIKATKFKIDCDYVVICFTLEMLISDGSAIDAGYLRPEIKA